MKDKMKKCSLKNRFFFALLVFFVVASVLFLSSCANLMQGKIKGDILEYESLSSVVKSGSYSKVLSTPTQVNATQNEFNSKIVLSWNSVDKAEYYTIERCVVDSTAVTDDYIPDESEFSVVCEYTDECVYDDYIYKNIEPSYNASEYKNRYYYRVSAYAENYETSDASSCDVYGTLFAATSEIEATCGTSLSDISVTWNKVSGASYYKVFQSDNPTGTYTQVGITQAPSIKVDIATKYQGVEFYYKVQAVNSSGYTTVNSAYAMGYAKEDGAPSAPTVTTECKGTTTDSITVSWNEITDDENTVYYAVYKKSSANSQKECLSSKTTATTITDDDVSPNVEYYYTVVAFFEKTEEVDGSSTTKNVKSEESKRCTAYLLSAPKNVFVENSSSGRTVMFQSALGYEENSDYSYNIYSYDTLSAATSATSSSRGTLLKTCSASELILNSSGYYEVTVNSDECNFARITTVKGAVESDLSDTAAPSPIAAKSVSASKAENVGVFTANSNGILPVKITWTASNDAYAFRVYRSTKAASGYTEITSSPILADGSSSYSFIDANSTAKVYTPYYYRVLTLNSLEKGTNYSTSDWGYGALTAEQYLIEYNKTIIRSQKKLPVGSTSTQTCNGDKSGTCLYDASGAVSLSPYIIMKYTNYADFTTVDGDGVTRYNFYLNGNTDTSITNVSSRSGHMAGTMVSTNAWYTGSIKYDNLQIVSSAAGGGYYTVTVTGFSSEQVDWLIGQIGW